MTHQLYLSSSLSQNPNSDACVPGGGLGSSGHTW